MSRVFTRVGGTGLALFITACAPGPVGAGASPAPATGGAGPRANPALTPTVTVFAVRAGQAALDGNPRDPGNPFAAAVVELLAEPALTLADWPYRLRRRTLALTRGKKPPDWRGPRVRPGWTPGQPTPGERRVAFVIVYSSYAHPQVNSLPGAAYDARRLVPALKKAGFRTVVYIDPTPDQLAALTRRIPAETRRADTAILYVTGHGMQLGREVILRRGDSPPVAELSYPSDPMIRFSDMAAWLEASSVNLAFFAGCRTRYRLRARR